MDRVPSVHNERLDAARQHRAEYYERCKEVDPDAVAEFERRTNERLCRDEVVRRDRSE